MVNCFDHEEMVRIQIQLLMCRQFIISDGDCLTWSMAREGEKVNGPFFAFSMLNWRYFTRIYLLFCRQCIFLASEHTSFPADLRGYAYSFQSHLSYLICRWSLCNCTKLSLINLESHNFPFVSLSFPDNILQCSWYFIFYLPLFISIFLSFCLSVCLSFSVCLCIYLCTYSFIHSVIHLILIELAWYSYCISSLLLLQQASSLIRSV